MILHCQWTKYLLFLRVRISAVVTVLLCCSKLFRVQSLFAIHIQGIAEFHLVPSSLQTCQMPLLQFCFCYLAVHFPLAIVFQPCFFNSFSSKGKIIYLKYHFIAYFIDSDVRQILRGWSSVT